MPMRPRGNRRRKLAQKKSERQKTSSQLVLEITQSLKQKIQSQEQWQTFVIEAITEKLAKFEHQSLIIPTEVDFQRIIEATPISIIISRIADGKIIYANPIASEILELSAQELLNHSIRDFCSDPLDGLQLFDTTVEEKALKNYEVRWQKTNGTILWVSIFARQFHYKEEATLIIACCDITQTKQVEQHLAETKSFLQLVLDNIPQLIFWKDRNSIFLGCNQLWAKAAGLNNSALVIGKTDEEIYQYPWNRHKHPPIEEINFYREQDHRVINTGQPELHFIEQRRNPDGQEVWYDTSKIPIKNSEGEIVGILGTIENITPRQLIERALLQEKELAQVTLHSIGEGVITTDAFSQIKDCNPVAEQLLGWSITQIRGRPSSEVFRLFDESTRQPVENPINRVLENGQVLRLENSIVLSARDETEYEVNITASPIRSRQGEIIGVVLVISDHTQSRQLTRQLSWQASHDPLTQLVNRQVFEQRVEDALSSAKVNNTIHTLGYLDLDQFKLINDFCGHVAGDELLRQISFLLQQRIRSTDTLARLGGDEFGLLLLHCSIEEGEKIAETLRQSVEDFRFCWEQQTFNIGISIGLVPINTDSADVNSLINTADTACYVAKSRGRNRIHTFDNNKQDINKQQQTKQWIARLNDALEENRFRLYTQPIIPLSPESQVEHHEILLRLFDEQGNMIMPQTFIPLAERYRVMQIIDQWVIETFFNYYLQHYQGEENQILYSLNLSAVSLNNNEFIEFLRQQLAHPQIRPQSICWEITERSAIANLRQIKQVIDIFKPLGCRFALEGVGTGITSLAYLKNLSVDYLKINGSLMQSMLRDSVDHTFVECLNQIAHALGMQTIAESVEHESILEPLRAIGVDYAQGYAIARPVPLS